MKKILAVSGGVDSMVLMHLFRGDGDVIVAHFNHGTRQSAQDDEEFVRAKALEYGLPFYVGRARLGEGVSEEAARISRYEFFTNLAREQDGVIFTAHHADDLVETMAISLIRGTDWRGLTPFGNRAVRRPFIETELLPGGKNRGENGVLQMFGRREIYQYASQHGLTFRLDPTNYEDHYLRNRVRERLIFEDRKTRERLLEIYHRMNILRKEIEQVDEEILASERNDDYLLSKKVLADGREKGKPARIKQKYARAWFKMDVPDEVFLELLRAILAREGLSATRPQRRDFLAAIRNYAPGKKFNLPGDRMAKIGTREFWIMAGPAGE